MSSVEDRPEVSGSSDAVQQETQDLGFLLLVSLLVMLNLPIFFFSVITWIDHYSFFAIDAIPGYPVTVVLNFALSTVMAVMGYVCYRWLRGRYSWFTGARWGPFTRGAVLSAIPIALAYSPSIVLTNYSGLASVVAISGIMAGCLCVTHALRDPEMELGPSFARFWFAVASATLLVFILVTVLGVMSLYRVDQSPPSGNLLLGSFDYGSVDLVYSTGEYAQRFRDALTGFTFSAMGFMTFVLGGSVFGAILSRMRSARADDLGPHSGQQPQAAPEWVSQVLGQLEPLPPGIPGDSEYLAVFDGYEFNLTSAQYERLIADKDDLLQHAALLVDGAAGDVFVKGDGRWQYLDFRIQDRAAGTRSGPYALLCIYARNPGRRFTNPELRALLQGQLINRQSVDIGDIIRQLRRRRPSIPIEREGDLSFMPSSFAVCFLDRHGAPSLNNYSPPHPT